MSVKKEQQQEERPQATIDPAALILLTHQIRNLLRFYQEAGVDNFPDCAGFDDFLGGRGRFPVPHTSNESRPSGNVSPRSGQAQSRAALSLEIEECRLCTLAESRLGQVLGRGSEVPKLFIVGDWSRQEGGFSDRIYFGPEEDGMLRRMMGAIGLAWEEIYVTNLLKCCPAVQPPDGECARHCSTYITREVSLFRPRLVLAMGEVAAAQLLGTKAPLVRLRGRFHSWPGAAGTATMIMPTFHPRFLLKNPEMKQMVWQDLQLVQRQLAR